MWALRPQLAGRNSYGLRRQLKSPRSTSMASAMSVSHNNTFHCDSTHIPGFLRWIEHCNNGAEALASGEFSPFEIENQTVGYLPKSFIPHLENFPDVFQLHRQSDDTNCTTTTVLLAPALQTADLSTRSAAVATVMTSLKDAGIITGWRNELYPVLSAFYTPPVLLIERAAAPFFGIKAYGVHINGFSCRSSDGEILLWMARRAATKPTWPGALDHIVAGGQPYGLSLAENVVKECGEEAGIPAELAAKAVPVGAVSYTSLQSGARLKRDVLFCYDLELPESFTPVPQDGEVEEFFLMSLPEVAAIIAQGIPSTSSITEMAAAADEKYKDNCNLVVIDFLIRHGVLAPDTDSYLTVLRGLRAGDCS